MIIGVPKERKTDESRVALRPDQAATLAVGGHTVLVETQAGLKSGFGDEAYRQAGAEICETGEVYRRARLILKVKCPVESEYDYYSDRHILFTYLHFDENIKPGNIARIVATGVTAIALEWVEENGRYVLLEPMSELSGAVFARKSMGLLMEHKGLLGGRYLDHWPAGTAMIIGGGHIGCNAVNVFARNQFKIILVDKNPATLPKRLGRYASSPTVNPDMKVIGFDESESEESTRAIREYLSATDIVIMAAVRRPTLPKTKCEYLLRREDIALLAPGSIVCDATACDRDLIETCVSSDSLSYWYVEEDVVHYNCDHIPALVPHTATQVLTEATFMYVKQLVGGFDKAIINPGLAKAVMCHRGYFTHEYSARKKHLEYMPLIDAIGNTKCEIKPEPREQQCVTS